MTVCGLLGFRSSSRLAGVTITIVMLVQNGTSHWTVALDRVGQVVLGIVVALLVSTLVFPDRARLRLRDGLAQEFLVLGAFFEAILQGFGGMPNANLTTTRENALAFLRSNNELLQAARNEPSGGPGWREGLGMSAQFGRSIFDALVALEFAVRDSHDDKYVQQLEPALRKACRGHSQRLSLSRRLHPRMAGFTCRRRKSILKKTLRNLRRAWQMCGPLGRSFLKQKFCAPMRCNCT